MKTIANLIRGAALAAVALITLTVPSMAQYSSPMHDVDDAARQPVQFDATFQTSNTGAVITPYVVPAGKRLVIELITGRVDVPPGQRIEALLTVTAGGKQLPHYLKFDPPYPAGPGVTADSFYTTLAVRLYADPPTALGLSVNRNDVTGSFSGTLTFSGYLVNLP